MMMDTSLAAPVGPRSFHSAPTSPDEFEALLVDHQSAILGYIKSLGADHHEAEDLLQITNMVLWRKRHTVRAGSNFRAWACTIARLEFLNRLRRQRRDRRVFCGAPFAEEAARDDPATGVEDDTAALMALQACLEMLPPRDLELLQMRYGSARTLEEYARNLNRSPGTLKARLFKIRETLRKRIERRLREAERASRPGRDELSEPSGGWRAGPFS